MTLDLKITAREINETLWRTHKTISTAESCTSGRIASMLTSIPGASVFFRGGLVAYTEDVKINMLKVSREVIEKQTVVCEDVVRQMVIGANEMFKSDYSVAVSGFAGPGGPDPKTGLRPGLIWIAVGNADNMTTMKLTEDEGREHNLQNATATALHMLLEIIRQDVEDECEEAANEVSATAN